MTGSRALAAGLALGLLALAALPVLEAPLVWDDLSYLMENPFTWTKDSLGVLVKADYFRHWADLPGYRPLSTLTHILDAQFWGTAPAGRRLENLLLHLAATGLLFLVMRDLMGDRPGVWWATALFALHPVHAESLYCAIFRTDLLAAVLGLAALHGMLKARAEGWSAPPVWAYGLYGLSLFAKEAAALLPAAVWLLPRGPVKGFSRRAWWGMLAVALVYPAVRVALGVSPFVRVPEIGPISLLDNLAVVCAAGVSGARLLVIGWPLRLEYLFSPSEPWLGLRAALGFLLAGGAAVMFFRWRRTRPAAAFGLAVAVAAWLPAAHLLPWTDTYYLAERYLYLPSAGLAMAFAALLPGRVPRGLAAGPGHPSPPAKGGRGGKEFPPGGVTGSGATARGGEAPIESPRGLRSAGAAAGCAALAVVYGQLLAARGRDWSDEVRLYRGTVEREPAAYKSWFNLGSAYQRVGRVDEAVAAYRRAGTGIPAHSWFAIGNLERERGNLVKAEEGFRKAVELDPNDAPSRHNLALALLVQKRKGDGERELRDNLRRHPDYEPSRIALTRLLTPRK